MKQPYNTIENVLMKWGTAQRQIPPKNEIIKNQILANLPVSPKKIRSKGFRMPWLSLALGGLAVITLVLSSGSARLKTQNTSLQRNFQCDASTGLRCSESGIAPSLGKSAMDFLSGTAPDYYPTPPIQEIPSTDTREFLKKDFGASIKTRHVQELSQRLETTVRGFAGRVDSSSSSEKSGFVSFVVPADRFDAFRNEVKSLAGDRFFTETISAQNLLPQKRSIEQQQNDVQANLAKLHGDRDQLIASHQKELASLQLQLNRVNKELSRLKADSANDSARAEANKGKELELQGEIGTLNARIADENSRYSSQLNSIDAQILNAEANLKNLNQQTTDLLDNVATVRGNISVSWVSIWEMLNLYLPSHWLPMLLIFAAIVAYFIQRRQSKLIIP